MKNREKPQFNEEDVQKAIECIKKKELSLRKAREVHGLTHTAILSYEETGHV